MTSKVDIRVRKLPISLRELAHEINELGLHLEFRPWVLLAEDGVSIVQIKETLTWGPLGATKKKNQKRPLCMWLRGVVLMVTIRDVIVWVWSVN